LPNRWAPADRRRAGAIPRPAVARAAGGVRAAESPAPLQDPPGDLPWAGGRAVGCTALHCTALDGRAVGRRYFLGSGALASPAAPDLRPGRKVSCRDPGRPAARTENIKGRPTEASPVPRGGEGAPTQIIMC
jgi:hypothetical protein